MKKEELERVKSLEDRHWYLGDFDATCEAVATLLREREQLLGALRAALAANTAPWAEEQIRAAIAAAES